jgi:hypothetical protein
MKYTWLKQPCTLSVMQRAVEGDIEEIPRSDPSKSVSIYGNSLCAFANESGLLQGLPRNELAERFLLAIGFHVNLFTGLAGNICVCANTKQPRKLPARVVDALQRGLEAALQEEEKEEEEEEEKEKSYAPTTTSRVLKPVLETKDPCLRAIRQAMETESSMMSNSFEDAESMHTDTTDAEISKKRKRQNSDT